MKRLLVSAALCSLSVSGALADETLKYRVVYHVTLLQSQEVGDVAGHALGIAHATGLAMLPDGGMATTQFVASLDFTNGTGPVKVYGSINYSDGSVLWVRNDVESTMKGDRAELRGPVTILGGKGRFAGATGTGSLTGYRMQVTPSSGAEVYNEITLNLKK
jgi:hypothetical protein